jgi:hypothetical protein
MEKRPRAAHRAPEPLFGAVVFRPCLLTRQTDEVTLTKNVRGSFRSLATSLLSRRVRPRDCHTQRRWLIHLAQGRQAACLPFPCACGDAPVGGVVCDSRTRNNHKCCGWMSTSRQYGVTLKQWAIAADSSLPRTDVHPSA